MNLNALTTDELLELEQLLKRQALFEPNEMTNPNYTFIKKSITEQLYDDRNNLIGGFRGSALEGSSRSGKTWAGVDIIIWLCLYVEKKGCTINIYRETYNEFKTTLYDDFKRRLDHYELPNPFHNAKEIKSFKIGKSTIFFLGDGKHGGGCDYAFFNEAMFISNSVFDQSEMRCRKFWWADYNPSVTEHWFFDKVLSRPDVGFLRTTWQNNNYITPQEKNKILGYEPYLPGSYQIVNDELFYKGKIIDDKNYPPPHPTNINSGTADEFMWKVYGLGLRGAMKGVIFNNIKYIDAFPDMGHIYTNDFGFTNDPNATVKYAETETDIYAELLIYEPIDNPDTLSAAFEQLELDKSLPFVCDSSDKYTGENKGTIEMVDALVADGWNASKISKRKSVMFWLASMKNKRINIVTNSLAHHAKKEAKMYRFREIAGIAINQPIDKYNHFWDAVRYGHMAWNEEFDDTEEWD
jgi:hypothetical protein